MLTLTPNREERIKKYLNDQLDSVVRSASRTARIESFKGMLRRYEAKTKPKTWPFVGASSLHIPFAATAVDSIKTRILNALKAQDKLIVTEPLTEEPLGIQDENGNPITWRDIAELLETYLLYEVGPNGDVDFEGAINELLDDTTQFGTGILKVGWETIKERDYHTDGSYTDRVTKDNVRFSVPAIEKLYFPSGYDSFDRIPFITEEYNMRPSEILQMVGDGPKGWKKSVVMEFLEKYGDPTGIGTRISPLQEEQSNIEKTGDTVYYQTPELAIGETWARLDLDGNGYESRILIEHAFDDYNFIFRIIPWPYEHGQLPYHLARYIRRRKRIYGMGIIERCEAIDEGISTNINQIIDNTTVANTRIWKGKAGSTAIEAMTSIYPNMVVPLDDPNDLVPEMMGSVGSDLFEAGNILREYGERVVKLSDYNLGRESQALGRQATATSTLALLQESGSYFDNISRDIRVCLKGALVQWLYLIIQQRPFDRIKQVLGDKADPLIAALMLPPGDLHKRIGVYVSFSNTAATRELARQEEQAKLATIGSIYQQLLALADMRMIALAGNAQEGLPPNPGKVMLIDEIGEDTILRTRRFLETYGETRSTTTFPDWSRTIERYSPPLPGGAGVGPQQPILGAPPSSPPGGDGGGGGAIGGGGPQPLPQVGPVGGSQIGT